MPANATRAFLTRASQLRAFRVPWRGETAAA
jgi:hypothetical protein